MDTLQIPSSNASGSLPDAPPISPSPNPSAGGQFSDMSHGSQSSLNKLNDVHLVNSGPTPVSSRIDTDTLLLARECRLLFFIRRNIMPTFSFSVPVMEFYCKDDSFWFGYSGVDVPRHWQ